VPAANPDGERSATCFLGRPARRLLSGRVAIDLEAASAVTGGGAKDAVGRLSVGMLGLSKLEAASSRLKEDFVLVAASACRNGWVQPGRVQPGRWVGRAF